MWRKRVSVPLAAIVAGAVVGGYIVIIGPSKLCQRRPGQQLVTQALIAPTPGMAAIAEASSVGAPRRPSRRRVVHGTAETRAGAWKPKGMSSAGHPRVCRCDVEVFGS